MADTHFARALNEAFGERSSEFSQNLLNRLHSIWEEGVQIGIEFPHECGNFFTQTLSQAFGERSSDFSQNLLNRLQLFWEEGVQIGTEVTHECGNFCPSSQGPVGPEGCPACQIINGED